MGAEDNGNRRRYRGARTKEEAGLRRLVGAAIGAPLALAGVVAVRWSFAEFEPGTASKVATALLVAMGAAAVAVERLFGSRKNQEQNRGPSDWDQSWLDKPPYRPQKPKARRWW